MFIIGVASSLFRPNALCFGVLNAVFNDCSLIILNELGFPNRSILLNDSIRYSLRSIEEGEGDEL